MRLKNKWGRAVFFLTKRLAATCWSCQEHPLWPAHSDGILSPPSCFPCLPYLKQRSGHRHEGEKNPFDPNGTVTVVKAPVSNLYLTKQQLPARWGTRYEYLPSLPPFVRSYAHPRLADSTVKMKIVLCETALGALVFHSGPLPGFTYVLVWRGAGRNHD